MAATVLPAASGATKKQVTTSGLSGTIIGCTNANPAVVTTNAAHGLKVGDLVIISGVLGSTGINSPAAVGVKAQVPWLVTAVGSSTTFTIAVAAGGAWTSGGVWSSVSLPNLYGILVRNLSLSGSDNAVNTNVYFDSTGLNGGFPIKPGDAIRLDPSDAADTSQIWLQSADASTAQTVQVLVSGAR